MNTEEIFSLVCTMFHSIHFLSENKKSRHYLHTTENVVFFSFRLWAITYIKIKMEGERWMFQQPNYQNKSIIKESETKNEITIDYARWTYIKWKKKYYYTLTHTTQSSNAHFDKEIGRKKSRNEMNYKATLKKVANEYKKK